MASAVRLQQDAIDQIDDLLASGGFASREEVIGVAVRRLAAATAWIRETEAHIERGLDDIDAGRTHTIEEVRAYFRQRK
jgi:Arc/MetJ-type ribon-helix-helix transcriptional regulator